MKLLEVGFAARPTASLQRGGITAPHLARRTRAVGSEHQTSPLVAAQLPCERGSPGPAGAHEARRSPPGAERAWGFAVSRPRSARVTASRQVQQVPVWTATPPEPWARNTDRDGRPGCAGTWGWNPLRGPGREPASTSGHAPKLRASNGQLKENGSKKSSWVFAKDPSRSPRRPALWDDPRQQQWALRGQRGG